MPQQLKRYGRLFQYYYCLHVGQWLTRQLIDAGLIILGKANMTVRLVSGDSSLTS